MSCMKVYASQRSQSYRTITYLRQALHSRRRSLYWYTRTWQAPVRVLLPCCGHVENMSICNCLLSLHLRQCGCICDRGWSIDDRRRLRPNGFDLHQWRRQKFISGGAKSLPPLPFPSLSLPSPLPSPFPPSPPPLPSLPLPLEVGPPYCG